MQTATLKWFHTTVKKMLQNNITTVATYNSPNYTINGGLTTASSGISTQAISTDTVLQIDDIRLSRSDFKDLMTIVRMMQNLDSDHPLKQEFLIQRAQDRLQGEPHED